MKILGQTTQFEDREKQRNFAETNFPSILHSISCAITFSKVGHAYELNYSTSSYSCPGVVN
ncbi:hypothetical protein C5167_034532 [Papaver somniferum]|uniref:Uncharacterized protein n=1 Tax=Papaver somniferum TaxID=3469 RepID=A0A4Y7KHH3_PAPSO|nr:hypothetical protein C5167_034532 [Papaver somniferum]